MSLFSPTSITCTACKHLYTMDAVGSVNADRRPDYRDDILEDRFQMSACPECGEAFRLEPLFAYLDAGREQWIAAQPARLVTGYRQVEADTMALFNKSYGAGAPRAARDVGDTLNVRLTFGWPAVREKLRIRDHDLNDVTVELMKLDLLRRLPEAPIGTGMEMRLIALEGNRMSFQWLRSDTEAVESAFSVGKELYDVISADADGWADLRAVITDGPFVDMQKTFLPGGPVADASAVAAQ